MPNTQTEYTLSGITDTTSHNLPDTDGDDKAEAQTPFEAVGDDKLAIYVTNHADQPLTAELQRAATHDRNMAQPVTDTGGVTVGAGDTEIIAADNTVPLAYFRTTISYDSIPTSADPSITVRFQSE